MPDSLKQVRLAQLRARATRFGIGRVVLGTAFLAGALGFATAPDRHSDESVLWASALLVMSTFYVGTGLRVLTRVRRRPASLWLAATGAWGLLSLALLGMLLRG